MKIFSCLTTLFALAGTLSLSAGAMAASQDQTDLTLTTPGVTISYAQLGRLLSESQKAKVQVQDIALPTDVNQHIPGWYSGNGWQTYSMNINVTSETTVGINETCELTLFPKRCMVLISGCDSPTRTIFAILDSFSYLSVGQSECKAEPQ